MSGDLVFEAFDRFIVVSIHSAAFAGALASQQLPDLDLELE